MQALQNTKLCFGVLRANSACKIAVRFAGGGGRPGARPSKFLFFSINKNKLFYNMMNIYDVLFSI